MRKQLIVTIVVAAIASWLAPQPAFAGDTTITTQVFSGGATNSWSADSSYHLQGSFRHTAIRRSLDGGYVLGHGFWAYFQSCCIGIRGNVDGDPSEAINVGDLTYLVDYLFQSGPVPSCWEEGNVDGDPSEAINVGDLTYLIDFLYDGGPAPPACS